MYSILKTVDLLLSVKKQHKLKEKCWTKRNNKDKLLFKKYRKFEISTKNAQKLCPVILQAGGWIQSQSKIVFAAGIKRNDKMLACQCYPLVKN